MPQRPPAHRSFRIDLDGDRAQAVCSCGWRSEPALNGGMAGAMWDTHLDDVLSEAGTGEPDDEL